MSDPKPIKKIDKYRVPIHDDFEDEPIVCNLPKELAKGMMDPRRRLVWTKWDDDPGEAIQDPDYWINL
jgi:hypothetical protein